MSKRGNTKLKDSGYKHIGGMIHPNTVKAWDECLYELKKQGISVARTSFGAACMAFAKLPIDQRCELCKEYQEIEKLTLDDTIQENLAKLEKFAETSDIPKEMTKDLIQFLQDRRNNPVT